MLPHNPFSHCHSTHQSPWAGPGQAPDSGFSSPTTRHDSLCEPWLPPISCEEPGLRVPFCDTAAVWMASSTWGGSVPDAASDPVLWSPGDQEAAWLCRKIFSQDLSGAVALKQPTALSLGQADSKARRHAPTKKTKRNAQLKLKAKSKPAHKTLQQAGPLITTFEDPNQKRLCPSQGPPLLPAWPSQQPPGREETEARVSTQSHPRKAGWSRKAPSRQWMQGSLEGWH